MRKQLFDISTEISIIHEIRDIRDELNMMRHVLDDQNRVLLNLYGKSHEGKPKGPGRILLEDLSEESESTCRVYLDSNSTIVDRLSRDANEVYNAVSYASNTILVATNGRLRSIACLISNRSKQMPGKRVGREKMPRALRSKDKYDPIKRLSNRY
jgi:hypothetical protein